MENGGAIEGEKGREWGMPMGLAATLVLLLLGGSSDLDAFGEREVVVLIRVLSQSILGNGLESLLHVDGLLGRGLEVGDVALGLAPGEGTLLGHNTLVLQINLVTQDDEGEVVRITGPSLDEELIPPAVQVLECLGYIHVEYQHTAISSSVESYTQALEALLTSSVPNLHGNKAVLNHHLLGQEVSTDSGFVLVAELLVHVLVHEGGLACTTVTQDDDLQQNLLSRRHCWL
jgi:hypothetical protein